VTGRRGDAGFTLIELLISMSLITIVMMATITAFVSFNHNERVNRLQNES
jgi:prepilin-type N-terminal cleavage/methylation domain-containing protein